MNGGAANCITSVRGRIRALMQREQGGGAPRNLVVLALDGIPANLGMPLWRGATVTPLLSVFPTTSSAAWLSSLSGMTVEQHGIPGVVFHDDAGQLIHLFEHHSAVPTPAIDNMFSDAAACGYRALAPMGDWRGIPAPWLGTLLGGAELVPSHTFLGAGAEPGAATALAVFDTVRACCARRRAGKPVLVWCFVDADRYIHTHGYDGAMMVFLETLDALAGRIVDELGAVVVCHSDHGLVPTNHVPDIAAILGTVAGTYGAQLGGAGRTRWIYPCAQTGERMLAFLDRSLPASVQVRAADDLFGARSLARRRVGEIVLVASGADFVTFDGQRHEHGSWDAGERVVPFAAWNA